jgi:hypothetical protein
MSKPGGEQALVASQSRLDSNITTVAVNSQNVSTEKRSQITPRTLPARSVSKNGKSSIGAIPVGKKLISNGQRAAIVVGRV